MISSTNANTGLQKQLVDMALNAGRPVSIGKQEYDAIKKSKDTEQLKQDLLRASKILNEEMNKINTDISFDYNDDIQGLVVIVREGGGNKVIREIPSKEAIALMKKMHDMVGLIFDKKG